ncbi:MAG: MFS transporter, partial [Nocardioides sp.]
SWRGPFFFSAIVTAVLLVVAARALPESVGYLLERRSVGALAAYNRIAARIGVAPAAELPPAPRRATGSGRPTLTSSLWQGIMLPRTLLLWFSYALVIAAFYFANGLTAKLVTQTTGNPDFGVRAQALVATGGVVGALLFALLARKIHPHLVTALVALTGFGVFFAFAAVFEDRTAVLICAVLVGLAANGGVAAFYAISPSLYPVAVRAAAIGMMMGVGRVVAFFAPNIATFLEERGFTPADLYRLYGVVLLVASAAVLALHATYRGHATSPAEDEERELVAAH